MKDAGRWKDYLLKSSLPLEQVVRRRLGDHGFGGLGSFSYLRENENGATTEFSVDVWGSQWLGKERNEWAAFDLLVECKYNYPGVCWVFSPYDADSLVISGCFTRLDQITTRRLVNPDSLERFDHPFTYCTRGIEIHSSGFDGNSIERGFAQLRYAMPNFVAMRLMHQMETWHDEELLVHLVSSLLVTTADLWVLRPDVELDAIQRANALEDVAVKVPALIHHQRQPPHLEVYASSIRNQLVKGYPEIFRRLEELRSLSEEKEQATTTPLTLSVDHLFEFAAQNVLVVNLTHLDGVVRRMKRCLRLAEKCLERIGRLDVNWSARTRMVIAT